MNDSLFSSKYFNALQRGWQKRLRTFGRVVLTEARRVCIYMVGPAAWGVGCGEATLGREHPPLAAFA